MDARDNPKKLLDLPPEVLEGIFAFLDPTSLLKIHQTAKSLYHHFSFWNAQPIPIRENYLADYINRPGKYLKVSAESHIKVLLVGSRSIQANIISRPRLFFEDSILPLELDQEDYFGHEKFKMKIYTSLSDGYEVTNLNEKMLQAHIIVLCVNNREDLNAKYQVLDNNLNNLQVKPLVFVIKPAGELLNVDDHQKYRIIDIRQDCKRDWLARVLIEKLLQFAERRDKEISSFKDKTVSI